MIYRETRVIFTNFLCVLPMTVVSPTLASLQYVMYFRFCEWRHVFLL